jgi:RimJ/RimL family protein N-acetyltransferase
MNPVLIDFPDRFKTARLEIRAPKPGDGAALNGAVLESWAEISPWVPWAKKRPSVEDSETVVRESMARFILRQDLMLLLFEKETATFVGGCGLHRINWDVPSFEIGYWVRTKFAGQGYITEAVKALADFAFSALGARRVHLQCDARNVRSQRVAERAGFALEASLHQSSLANDGTLADMMIYARLR